MTQAPETIKSVISGDDGWLFLAGGAHGPLRFAMGETKPPATSYSAFHRNIKQRHLVSSKLGCSYFHLSIPDKHNVCIKPFPYQTKFCLLSSYHNSLPQDLAARAVDPTNILKTLWKTGYYKNDTHLRVAPLRVV
jgi:hypothetical protein